MLKEIKGKLIVSVQALEDEPLYGSETMVKMANAALMGGACAFRVQGISDINAIKKALNLPVIGIIKKVYDDSEVYITPTFKEVDALLETDCEMIALDATSRIRPNNVKLEELITYIKQHQRLVMADISTYEEAVLAMEYGCDCISTTLCGYTIYSNKVDGPDFTLIKRLVNDLNIPIIAEGKINTPADLKAIKDTGVYSYVVGSAITRPQLITKTFTDVLRED
ncbi:MAG: N-acetylmannosamine-6-phosphate 2-epimerase [Bacilli bacterium]